MFFMRKSGLFITFIFLLVSNSNALYAQLKVKVSGGLIYIDEGSFGGLKKPDEKKYIGLTDSLDKNLKLNPNDTTSLYLRAVLYLSFNNMNAKPYQRTNGALANLTIAKDMAEKAVALKMHNFNLKVLRAGIYRELVYRFTGDESWMFNSEQKAERRKLFNDYKEAANKYYNELAKLDSRNAYSYQQLLIKDNYPL
jgi:hypothetical protein